MAGLHDGSSAHKDCRASRIKASEATVANILQTLSSWSDPFPASEEDDSLINISSGVLVPEAVKSDLLNAEAIGEKRFLQFVNNRLKSNKEKFHDPISKLQLKTFTSVVQKKKSKVKGQEIMIKTDRNLMARMLVAAQTRDLDLRLVLSHELGPIPWSIANADGSLVKTAKATLLSLLEKRCPTSWVCAN